MSGRKGLAAAFVLGGLLILPAGTDARTPRTPPGNPTVVLESARGETTHPVSDLRFVYFERIVYSKRAPRSEEARGLRTDVEDRRRECRCVRLEDWSKLKFSQIRQIEIAYPEGEPVARLRVMRRDGSVREIRADSLFGAADSLAPRFSATVDGQVREFPLLLEPGASWPEERLSRLLLLRPPPRRGRR